LKMKLRAFAATGALLATLLVAAPAEANTVKINGKCDKANSVASVSGKAVKCTKSGSKLSWKQYSPKATSKDQVPVGVNMNIGSWTAKFLETNDDVSEFICEQNMFNDGCTVNDDYDGVPDPASKKRWVEFVFEMRNRSKEDLSPSLADVGVLNKGKVIWHGMFQPSTDDSALYMTLIPGGKSRVSYYVFLDKGIKPDVAVLKPEYFSNKSFYFKTKR